MSQFLTQEQSGLARFDFAVHDAAGHLTALVEARRRLGANGVWAAQWRKNFLSHGPLPHADLMVLIVPDRLFVWTPSAPPDARPTDEVDAHTLFAPYFERIGVGPERIEPMAFELMVGWWLEDLAREGSSRALPELSRSGFVDAVAGAHITRGSTA